MKDSVQKKVKVVSAETMEADTLYKHCRARHPGLLRLYPFVARLRVEHREEHNSPTELDPLNSFSHYHADPE